MPASEFRRPVSGAGVIRRVKRRIAPSAADPEPVVSESRSFADLGLHPMLVQRLADGGYQAPTPIQAQAIPPLLAGRDVVGQAQTGTGKTAAFALPMIQALDVEKREVQGLVLCPTRELALQVTAALSSYGESIKVRVLTVYGGTPIYKQICALRSGVHIVVGTPGRIKDCIARGALSLATVRHVVLDEADEMLRMGFIEDVEEILSQVPETRQTALFSATMPEAIQRVASAYLRDPVQVKIDTRTRAVEIIDQRVLVTDAGQKLNVLARLIEAEPTDAVLVFARTRASCAHLVDLLRTRGVAAAALHGDLSQDQREAIVSQLRARKIQLVVATDIAARGLDVEGITHVINYDPPSEPEVYVHRIGRTGRAGRGGVSILLVTPRERRLQSAIERYTGQKMTPMQIPTNEELLAGRTAHFRSRVQQAIEKGGLDPYEKVVGDLSSEPGMDLQTIASALARMASGERPLRISDPEPTAARTSSYDRTSSREAEEGSVRLFVSIGRQAGVRPADLVGAIANEAGVPGRAVGAISICEKVSFVDVSAEYADAIIERMARVTVRGRTAAFIAARPMDHEKERDKPSPPRVARHVGTRSAPGNRPAPGRHTGPGDAKPWRKHAKKRPY